MAALAANSGKLLLASTALSGAGGIYSAMAERRAASEEAAAYRREAQASRASAQRAADEEIRRSRFVRSRARAAAAASGANTQDPSLKRNMADLEAEGVYSALSRLYTGETEARGLEDRARVRKRVGRARAFGSLLNSATTVLSGVETWKSRYG